MVSQLTIVLAILAVTVVLIVTELVRIDVVAIAAMLALIWTGSLTAEEARSGFASNAVLAIIGVMIMGRGLYRVGFTDKLANFILEIAGRGQKRVMATVSVTVGTMSGLMQNLGAAALFLPVMMGISKREKIPISTLLMPMGFAALLGGTVTMVGTSSLIVLNDLLSSRGLDTYGLFAVTPIGLALLSAGILYFTFLGQWVLPTGGEMEETDEKPGQKLLNIWGLSPTTYELRIPESSDLVGRTVEESKMGAEYGLNLLRVYDDDEFDYDIWGDTTFEAEHNIVVQGDEEHVATFKEDHGLELREEEEKTPAQSDRGYIEVVIPARSNLVGETLRDLSFRETFSVQVVLFFSDSEAVEDGMADRPLKAGDTLVLYGKWQNLQFVKESEDFINVTPFDYDPKKTDKLWWAVLSFVGAIALTIALGLDISTGFMTGAMVMIFSGVLTIEDAYRAIEWKVVFLISGLIPIGIAMEKSGAAKLFATGLVATVGDMHPFVILVAIGALTTFFSLIMSNVAATVLLVPLVLELASQVGLSSSVLVLQVGVCAANSFIIPTHHVNALLMTPGGYQVSDYLKAGSILSVIFILVSSSMLYFVY